MCSLHRFIYISKKGKGTKFLCFVLNSTCMRINTPNQSIKISICKKTVQKAVGTAIGEVLHKELSLVCGVRYHSIDRVEYFY